MTGIKNQAKYVPFHDYVKIVPLQYPWDYFH